MKLPLRIRFSMFLHEMKLPLRIRFFTVLQKYTHDDIDIPTYQPRREYTDKEIDQAVADALVNTPTEFNLAASERQWDQAHDRTFWWRWCARFKPWRIRRFLAQKALGHLR